MVVSAGQVVESQPALAGFQVVGSNQAVLDDVLEGAATPSQLGSSEPSHEDQEETAASQLVREDGVGYNPREFDRDLFEAGTRLPLDMSSLRMPWEGTFMIRQIFGMPHPDGWVRKRTTWLPVAMPMRGVSKSNLWAKSYQEVLIEFGLLRGEELQGSCLMPALKKNVTFSQVPLDSTSASIRIREVLVSYGVHHDDVKVLASHSMRTPTLSWNFASSTKPAVQTLEETVAVVITKDSMQQEESLSVKGDVTEEGGDASMSNQGDFACRRDDKQRDQPADSSGSSSDSEVSSQDSQAALDRDETFAAGVTGIKPAPAGAPCQ